MGQAKRVAVVSLQQRLSIFDGVGFFAFESNRTNFTFTHTRDTREKPMTTPALKAVTKAGPKPSRARMAVRVLEYVAIIMPM